MAQFGRPTTDTTVDNWEEDDGTTVNIFDQIDEASFDDADFIRTQTTPTADVYVTKLTSLTDPVSSAGHTVRWRDGKDASSGDQIDITVQLRQGYVSEGTPGTLIAAQTNTNVTGSAFNARSIALSGAEADAITDYTDLFIRVVGNKP